ncbi:MAG: hypothetical protein HYX38_27525 [Rhodospirillales bacterium]|nr:hypothetical protein [Rhodospirillales bacterium]
MTTIARVLAVMALMLTASLAQAQGKVPSERALEALVKATLLSFNDANVTGNYEVFHAKLSKPFREQFPVERLAQRFQEFNKKHIDFDIIAALKPAYDPAPAVDDDGRLLVKGHFPTEPRQVYFDLKFIPSDGEWKLIGINVKIDDPK